MKSGEEGWWLGAAGHLKEWEAQEGAEQPGHRSDGGLNYLEGG